MLFNRFFLALACLMLVLGAALPAAAALPPAPVATQVPVVDTYFGTTVTDPYRWMEQPNNPELQAYLKAQNDRTRAILDSIPARKELLARITALSDTVNSSTGVVRRKGMLFYQKIVPGSSISKVYVRSGIGGAERILIDPEKVATSGQHLALSYWLASDDGKYVVAGLSPGGSESATAYIFETATGKTLPDTITRTDFGATAWKHDDSGFYYARLQAPVAGAPVTAKYQNINTYLHRLGSDPEKDALVFGHNPMPKVTIDPDSFTLAFVTPESSYAFGLVINGVQREVSVYIAPKSELDGGKANWRLAVTPADQITAVALHGNDVYLLSHKNAPRFKVLRIHAASPNVANAQVIVAPSARVYENLYAAKDALYVQSLQDGLGRISRIDWTGKRSEIPLPVNGTVSDLSTEADANGFLAKLEGWTVPPLWYAYDPATNLLVDTKLDPSSPVDYSAITSEEVKVKARDGTMVPLSIVHRKDMKMDGSTPLLLYAYGSYGINSNPSFSASRMAWFERGGALAVAHVRGGGEYGEEWHLAGKDSNKLNTITDFIDTAKWLIENKYTSPGKLGARGGSAGGITMGGAITQAPELFAAVLDEIPLSDALRFEFSANGPPNVPEFGSTKTAQGFKNLYAISAIQAVKPGGKYPGVMVTTGANDPRVDPWQAAKMAATLQADNAGPRPILLRVDFEGGHGLIGATKAQGAELSTDEYSFLLWNMGVAGFQPTI